MLCRLYTKCKKADFRLLAELSLSLSLSLPLSHSPNLPPPPQTHASVYFSGLLHDCPCAFVSRLSLLSWSEHSKVWDLRNFESWILTYDGVCTSWSNPGWLTDASPISNSLTPAPQVQTHYMGQARHVKLPPKTGPTVLRRRPYMLQNCSRRQVEVLPSIDFLCETIVLKKVTIVDLMHKSAMESLYWLFKLMLWSITFPCL